MTQILSILRSSFHSLFIGQQYSNYQNDYNSYNLISNSLMTKDKIIAIFSFSSIKFYKILLFCIIIDIHTRWNQSYQRVIDSTQCGETFFRRLKTELNNVIIITRCIQALKSLAIKEILLFYILRKMIIQIKVSQYKNAY